MLGKVYLVQLYPSAENISSCIWAIIKWGKLSRIKLTDTGALCSFLRHVKIYCPTWNMKRPWSSTRHMLTIKSKIWSILQQMLFPHFQLNEAWNELVAIPTMLFACLDIFSPLYFFEHCLNDSSIFFDIISIFRHSWPAVPHENCSSCPGPEDSLKETSALASSILPKSSFMNCDFVPCVILSISAALVRDFRASSVHSSSLQWEKRSLYVSL